ncbi:hypothetical protein J7L87_05125 [bacterium]|nr:hypothetical protein [bacterium]
MEDIIRSAAKQLFEKPHKEVFSIVEKEKPQENEWFIVDIKKYCNGDFITWTGDGLNLKYVEQGDRIYYGVPFHILSQEKDKKTCIKIKSELLSGYTNLEIPLQKKVKALFFLYTGYYAVPGDAGERKIIFEYEDGKKEEINLIGGKNLFDWFPQKRYESEKIKYILVKTSETIMPPYRNLYILLWENPYPEKKINKIVFYSDGKGKRGIFILGITGLLTKTSD